MESNGRSHHTAHMHSTGAAQVQHRHSTGTAQAQHRCSADHNTKFPHGARGVTKSCEPCEKWSKNHAVAVHCTSTGKLSFGIRV